jgi:hypothetical protein
MTEHDEMCTCDRCMREDSDRTLQRVGDLERANARLREALAELVEVMTGVRFEGLAARTAAVSDAWHRANEMVSGFDEGGPS